LKINIFYVFVYVNDGKNILVSIIVAVTEISLHSVRRLEFFSELCRKLTFYTGNKRTISPSVSDYYKRQVHVANRWHAMTRTFLLASWSRVI